MNENSSQGNAQVDVLRALSSAGAAPTRAAAAGQPNIINVTASGGGDFPSLTEAMAAITDASPTNRYLVTIYGNTIEPGGVITLKEYVAVYGSKRDTLITCDGIRFGDGGTLQHGLECSNLTIQNSGSGSIGFEVANGDEIMLRSCSILNFTTGVKFSGANTGLITLEDFRVSNSTTGFLIEQCAVLQIDHGNFYNNSTVFNIKIGYHLIVSDSVIETFDTAVLFDSTSTAIALYSLVMNNVRFLSTNGAGSNTCRVVKSLAVNDDVANTVRGLELRGCSYWLTHAAYVIEVTWSGHLAGGADRFIMSLTGMHYIQYGDNTVAWFKSDNTYDGFVHLVVEGTCLGPDTIAIQDGTQPTVSGYVHTGLNAGSYPNAEGVLYGRNKWGSAGTKITTLTHGFADLVSGTAIVNTPLVTENSLIFLSEQSQWGNGYVWVSTRTPGKSFTIQSSNAADNCRVAWMMIEP